MLRLKTQRQNKRETVALGQQPVALGSAELDSTRLACRQHLELGCRT